MRTVLQKQWWVQGLFFPVWYPIEASLRDTWDLETFMENHMRKDPTGAPVPRRMQPADAGHAYTQLGVPASGQKGSSTQSCHAKQVLIPLVPFATALQRDCCCGKPAPTD